MSNPGKLNIAGRRDDFSELPGDSSRTRITLTMHDQRGYPQGGKLLGQGVLLHEVICIVAKELVDLEIDVQAIDKQLPGQLLRTPLVSDVSGPRQFTVRSLNRIKFGFLGGGEARSQVSELALFIRTEQRRSIGAILSMPGSINARPGEVDQRAYPGGMCKSISKRQCSSPGMPQDDPLPETPMLAQGIKISDGRGDIVGRTACGSATGALVVAVERHQVIHHRCHGLQVVPYSRAAVATDKRRSFALAHRPERAASNADHLDVLHG